MDDTGAGKADEGLDPTGDTFPRCQGYKGMLLGIGVPTSTGNEGHLDPYLQQP